MSCCELPYPIVIRYLRFRPVSWEEKICWRVGVYGIGNVTGKYIDIVKLWGTKPVTRLPSRGKRQNTESADTMNKCGY